MEKTKCRFPQLLNNCKPLRLPDGSLKQGYDVLVLYGEKAFGHKKICVILNYTNGLLDSELGMPAVQFEDFHLEWWKDGKLHRDERDEEGNLLPAIIAESGEYREYWLNGKRQDI